MNLCCLSKLDFVGLLLAILSFARNLAPKCRKLNSWFLKFDKFIVESFLYYWLCFTADPFLMVQGLDIC